MPSTTILFINFGVWVYLCLKDLALICARPDVCSYYSKTCWHQFCLDQLTIGSDTKSRSAVVHTGLYQVLFMLLPKRSASSLDPPLQTVRL